MLCVLPSGNESQKKLFGLNQKLSSNPELDNSELLDSQGIGLLQWPFLSDKVMDVITLYSFAEHQENGHSERAQKTCV